MGQARRLAVGHPEPIRDPLHQQPPLRRSARRRRPYPGRHAAHRLLDPASVSATSTPGPTRAEITLGGIRPRRGHPRRRTRGAGGQSAAALRWRRKDPTSRRRQRRRRGHFSQRPSRCEPRVLQRSPCRRPRGARSRPLTSPAGGSRRGFCLRHGPARCQVVDLTLRCIRDVRGRPGCT